MPFGRTNAPETFQRTLDIVLSSFKWQTCHFYLEDVIVFLKNIEDHFNHVGDILTVMQRAGSTLKLPKCDGFLIL